MDVKNLTFCGITAFDGLTRNGLQLHPDGKHILYPVGQKIAVKDVTSGRQNFLTGHTNTISTINVSPCGNFVASGQTNHCGYKASVIVWNYKEQSVKFIYEMHKARVEDLCFSCDGNYLTSLGGKDDGRIVVWDVHNNEALCGSTASDLTAGNAHRIMRMNIHNHYFVTAGERNLKVWRIDPVNRKIRGIDVKVGKLKRTINCIAVCTNDKDIYCGTSSGDVINARLNLDENATQTTPIDQEPIMIGCYSKISHNSKKSMGDLYSGGVNQLIILPNEKIIVGSGDGVVEIIEIVDAAFNKRKTDKQPTTPQINSLKTVKLPGEITSMCLHHNDYIYVGTSNCEIYQIFLSDLKVNLLVTCHSSAIYGLSFPWNYSEIFATGGKECIRLWQLETQKELLRITVPNFVCTSLCFSCDGHLIISGWNDGIVRACSPQTGQLRFAIHNAHVKTVSAVTITTDGSKLITGGCDGQVRVWHIKDGLRILLKVFKEHRGPITSLSILSDNENVVSSSTDGTCIIWDIKQYVRRLMLMEKTMFMASTFSPNGVQILTCGTNRKIAYWEVLDGSLVREIEASTGGPLNCLDISPDGQYLITGGNDCIVKFWNYHTADNTHIATEHAAIITACKFSPDGKNFVTVSADGTIIVWRTPFELNSQEIHARRTPCNKLKTLEQPATDTGHNGSRKETEKQACSCNSRDTTINVCECTDGERI